MFMCFTKPSLFIVQLCVLYIELESCLQTPQYRMMSKMMSSFLMHNSASCIYAIKYDEQNRKKAFDLCTDRT